MVNNIDTSSLHPLHVSTADGGGGAALGARQLHQSLENAGIDSRMLVFRKGSKSPSVYPYHVHANKLERWLVRQSVRRDKRPLKPYQRSDTGYWSVNSAPYSPIARIINRMAPSLVHLHWVADGFLPIQQLARIQAPIIWTLRDMWAMTGGCHHAYDCDGFTRQCGRCPQLNSAREDDLSHSTWQRKRKDWARLNLTIVALSRWLADEARRSSLLGRHRIEVIPNGVDTTQFKPIDATTARHVLNLPQDKKVILFGAFYSTQDKSKGFDLLQQTLRRISAERDDLIGVVFGADRPTDAPDVGMPISYLGTLHDTPALALAYASADVFVSPSRAESFNKTLTESMACGTPTVAFGLGGNPDIIDHEQNGYLAQPLDVEDLAQGITWTLNHANPHTLRENARQKIMTHFEASQIARRYVHLYETLV